MMKASKKMVMGLSFCLGLVLFVTTAFADISSKTGYDQLKDSIKFTTGSLSDKLQSYVLNGTVTLKDNDKVLVTTNSSNKYDNRTSAMETSESTEYADGTKDTSYYYRDLDCSIWYDSYNDTYNISKYTSPESDFKPFADPFKEERLKDMEKIFDALVGNLKDYVIVDDKSDGSKEFSGSLTEGQIPALVNAVSAFLFKQMAPGHGYDNQKDSIPQISDDVFIKNIKGKAVTNKDGIIESIFATGVLSGKDKEGNAHDLTLEVLGKVVDINSITVSRPDLSGKKVMEQPVKLPGNQQITDKFAGQYKNDIVIEKDNKFVKIGERIIEITSIADKHIKGRYYEDYKEGYEEYNVNKQDFTFDAEIGDYNNAEFKLTSPSGREEIGSISFDIMSGRLFFNIPYDTNQGIIFNSDFYRVFN